MLGNTWRDLRFALRSFAAQRGFTAAVTVSIALGIAANTTVFTMINALLLGDLPVRDPGSLVEFSDGSSFSWPDYVDYHDQTKAIFEGVSAHFPLVPASVGGSGEPERVWGQLADGASIVGRSVLLNSARYTVIGVTAPGFHGTERGLIGELRAPLSMAAKLMPDLHPEEMHPQRNSHWLPLMARLKPGVSRQKVMGVAVVLAIGLGLSLAVARLTASLLYGVSATDAATFAAVPVLMIAAGTLALLIPARRAARIEPLNALRYE